MVKGEKIEVNIVDVNRRNRTVYYLMIYGLFDPPQIPTRIDSRAW